MAVGVGILGAVTWLPCSYHVCFILDHVVIANEWACVISFKKHIGNAEVYVVQNYFVDCRISALRDGTVGHL
jgi:hypothetical protein